MQPKRGRGPGVIYLKTDDGETLELTTFDPSVLRDASENSGAQGAFSYIEKPNEKNPEKPYKNLLSMKLQAAVITDPSPEGSAGDSSDVDSEGATEVLPAVLRPINGALRPVQQVLRPTSALTPLQQLEQGFELAVRQRELLAEFIRSRFKENEHYFDGAMFGAKNGKRVLAQPGAQLILVAHGYFVDFDIAAGPMAAPSSLKESYTIVIKAKVFNKFGEQIGSGLGSCSALIWSSREGGYRGRAVDPDKTHNSTLKIAKKRALVDACLNTTAASEFFTQDLEEGGYANGATGAGTDPDQPKSKGLFKKR